MLYLHAAHQQNDQQMQVYVPHDEALEGDEHHGNGSDASGYELGRIGIDDADIDAVRIKLGCLGMEAAKVDAKDDARGQVHRTDGGHKECPAVDSAQGLLDIVFAHA